VSPAFATYDTPRFRGGGKQIQTANVGDFTGGLNLRAEAFSLGQNESPDLLNVDVDPRGGFVSRSGVAQWGPEDHDSDIEAVWRFDTAELSADLVAYDGDHLMTESAGSWVEGTAITGTVRATMFKDKLYLTNGSVTVKTWDGTSFSSVADPAASGGAGYNDDIEAPVGGFMPKGRCIAAHMGVVFVANTLEDSVRHPNRVRWSHPNFPEDWADFHYIDVDVGADGDEITALVPFNDRLLVFKKRSIYAIYGEPPEAFQVFNISREVGAIHQEAVAQSDLGVYFFHYPEGVYLFDGKATNWEFDRLLPTITDGDIVAAHADEIQLGWDGSRLYCSVPFEGSSVNNVTFVLDPRLTKEGSWVKYDLGLKAMTAYGDSYGDDQFIASAVDKNTLIELNTDTPFDTFGDGDVNNFDTYYVTRWLDMNEPGVLKRFKRPDIVMARGTEAAVRVEVYKDYDNGNATRNFTITSIGDATIARFGTAVFGVDVFSSESVGRHSVERGSPLGNARGVQLKFIGPDANSRWGVAGMTLKLIPKKVRG
jgi:hypothetical protein